MFIPVSTDAPLYHRPFATCGLILTNIVTFVLTVGGTEADGWLLTFGNGLHPTEWIASAFLHFGLMHLIGNMFFLWAYGLIIEGKIGSFRFLALYLFMAFLEGAIDQTLMLGAEDALGAGGASGVVFGLMAIALIWAPENEFEIVWVYFFGMMVRTGSSSVSVLFLSLFYLVINFIQASFFGFEMGTEVLHLLGALVGLPIGILFLKLNWVDCEQWDLFSVWSGKSPQGKMKPTEWKSSSKLEDRDRPNEVFKQRTAGRPHEQVETLVADKKYSLAAERYLDHREQLATSSYLPGATRRQLIEWLRKRHRWEDLAMLLEDYLRTSPPEQSRAALMLAQVSIRLSRPKAAQRALEYVETSDLSPKELQTRESILHQAKKLVNQGVIEISN